MAPHSSTLAWQIPWAEEPCRLQSMGSRSLGTTEWLHFHFSLSCIGEGNGIPLQCSCLENSRDGGAWWAAISGVTQSRTRWSDLAAAAAVAVRYPIVRPSAGIHVMFSYHDYTEIIGFGRKIAEVECFSHHKRTYYQHELSLLLLTWSSWIR